MRLVNNRVCQRLNVFLAWFILATAEELLRRLTKKGEPFVFGPEQAAFTELKRRLTQAILTTVQRQRLSLMQAQWGCWQSLREPGNLLCQ